MTISLDRRAVTLGHLIEPPALLQVVPVRQWLQALGRWPMGQTAQGLYAFQPRCVEFSD